MLQIKFCKRLLWMWTKEGCKFNFWGNIFFTTSQSVWYQIFWAKLQDAMDIHGFPNRKFCYFSRIVILLFKNLKIAIQTETSFWNLEKWQNFLFGNPWISMPSWVLVSIFKCKTDHIGAKNKFQINLCFATPVMWLALWGPCLPKNLPRWSWYV